MRGLTPEPQRSRLLAAAERVKKDAEQLTESEAELRRAVQEAREAGGSVREIAALIGRSTNTIQRWLRDEP